MKPRLAIILFTALAVTGLILYHVIPFKPADELTDFSSDGCSLFPDSSLINSDDWCSCCVDHDIAYWKGGTEAERLTADEALRDCVLKKTGDSELAEAMFIGVRMGGSPYFKNWYRWGYGWSYERKYGALSAEEHARAEQMLNEYFASSPQSPCEE